MGRLINRRRLPVLDTTYGIAYYSPSTAPLGEHLNIRFNRDIFRRNTSDLLVIKQVKEGYRVPVVLSVLDW